MTMNKHTATELSEMGYRFHHSACCRGYLHRKDENTCERYSGKFGSGYIIHKYGYYAHGRRNCTNYHTIEYWIKENEA